MLMRIKGLKRCSAAVLCLALIFGATATYAESVDGAVSVTEQASLSGYADYLKTNSGISKADTSIVLLPDEFYPVDGANIKAEENYSDNKKALVWENGNGSITAEISVPKDALYSIKLTYLLPETGTEPEIGVKIDGKYPFSSASNLVLPREWKNTEENIKTDKKGNELTPEQVETGEFITYELCDRSGVYTEPYLIALTAGAHSFTVCSPNQTIAFACAELAIPETAEEYKECDVSAQSLDTEPIIIEGESADVKSSNAFVPLSDTGNAGMSPASAYTNKLNYIGGSSWNSPGDKITWSFNVEKSGYYKLCFRYKQADVINGESWRWLKIDGETPFSECKSLRFAYDTGWEIFEFVDRDENPYYFYLDEGSHEISLEVTMGEMAEYYSSLSEIVTGLGDEYINIVKITGDSPDVNRDYELFNQIPDLNDRLNEYSEKLGELVEAMQSLTGKRGSQYIAAINNMIRVLNNMVGRPYSAHQYVEDYYTNYSTLSSWLYDMKNMPLSIDWMQFCPAEDNFTVKKTGIFKSAIFGIKRLIYSFNSDYQVGSDGENSEELTLWVNWGRDQTNVLTTLINDSFTSEKGITVNVKQTNASLINGILAGNFPDVVLHLSRTDPVNLGIRGALSNLYEFEDCKDVLNRFQDGSEIPYSYDNELYALPDTQNFYIMFYRTDIFENLGLSVPKTWDEFLETATIIQQNNMQVYIPYTQITTSTTVNSGIGSLNLYATLMLQRDLSLYNENQTATALTEPEALQTFEYWTDLYLDYQFVKEADFYNRFRMGTMPLGIAQYSTYLTLYDAAPEIKGRWAVANVPATADSNGYVAGSGTGCGIVKKSENQQAAWEFLKWWTGENTQTRYSNNIESILGMLGRPQTANVEAFKNLAWDTQDKENILEQWSLVREIPELPGSYYLTRSVDQAFWQVINGKSNVKDAVVKWSRVADSEIERKLNEYGK